jgi:hypothetical protein
MRLVDNVSISVATTELIWLYQLAWTPEKHLLSAVDPLAGGLFQPAAERSSIGFALSIELKG